MCYFTHTVYINYLITPCIPLRLCVHAWCCKSHNLTVPSLPPDAIKTLFERVMCVTGPLWIDFHSFSNLLAVIGINNRKNHVNITGKKYWKEYKFKFDQLLFQSHNLNSPLLWWVIMPVSSLQRPKQFIVSSCWSASVPSDNITEPLLIDSTDTAAPFWQNKYSAFTSHWNERVYYKYNKIDKSFWKTYLYIATSIERSMLTFYFESVNTT